MKSRRLIAALLVVSALGLGARLYFSPNRLRAFVEDALQHARESGNPLPNVAFKEARLVLGHGLWPTVAVRLSDVTIAALPGCATDRWAAQAEEVEIPLRWSRLVRQARWAAGTVRLRNLTVDSDAWRSGCGLQPNEEPARVTTPAPARHWWSPGDLARTESVVEGLQAEGVRLLFENREKSVMLERVSLRLGPDAVRVHVRLSVPPEWTFGEALPRVEIEGEVKADGARATARADLEEGRLKVEASLRPREGGHVELEARASAIGVPASVLAPLAGRAGLGLAGSRFNPKFLWLSCSAEIQGRVHDLFATSPVKISACALDGASGRVAVESAVRKGDGSWAPFKAHAERLDARAWLEAFGVEGPRGVFWDFGRLNGDFEYLGSGDYRGQASLEGLKALFVHRDHRATQEMSLVASVLKRGVHARGRLEKATLVGGDFEGSATWDFDESFGRGVIDVEARRLNMAADVQRLMLDGTVKGLALSARVEFGEHRFRRASIDARLEGLISVLGRADAIRLQGDLTDGTLRLQARAPHVSIPGRGDVAEHVLRSSTDADAFIEAIGVSARLTLTTSGLGWEKAKAHFDDDRVQMMSSGNVRFALPGQLTSPVLELTAPPISGPRRNQRAASEN